MGSCHSSVGVVAIDRQTGFISWRRVDGYIHVIWGDKVIQVRDKVPLLTNYNKSIEDFFFDITNRNVLAYDDGICIKFIASVSNNYIQTFIYPYGMKTIYDYKINGKSVSLNYAQVTHNGSKTYYVCTNGLDIYNELDFFIKTDAFITSDMILRELPNKYFFKEYSIKLIDKQKQKLVYSNDHFTEVTQYTKTYNGYFTSPYAAATYNVRQITDAEWRYMLLHTDVPDDIKYGCIAPFDSDNLFFTFPLDKMQRMYMTR